LESGREMHTQATHSIVPHMFDEKFVCLPGVESGECGGFGLE
jgi:hypothetical protein